MIKQTRPEEKKIPDDEWNVIARHAITPSVNLIIENKKGEILFVKRNNEPAKDLLWVPGGRVKKTEYLTDTIWRVMKNEIAVDKKDAELIAVSREYQEEKFFTKDMDAQSVEERYGKDVESVEYWGTAAYLRLRSDDVQISLDSQSGTYQWLKELPNDHPMQIGYFRMLERMGYKTLALPPDTAA
jgi:colanic acid biosynthesis protein WcaH